METAAIKAASDSRARVFTRKVTAIYTPGTQRKHSILLPHQLPCLPCLTCARVVRRLVQRVHTRADCESLLCAHSL
jgi:hypothetical protein